jgi:hypothetical protein
MRAAADRMKRMRQRRQEGGLRELRLLVPDARLEAVRARVAEAVTRLDPKSEDEALDFIEAAGEFDVGPP